MDTAADPAAQTAYPRIRVEYSPIFKGLLVLFLSGFIPATAMSFLMVRRTKKQAEFARVVEVLGVAEDDAEFAHDRVAEQYAGRDYRLPILFAWLLSLLGFVSLLFGADLVGEHTGKPNFLFTGAAHDEAAAMQAMRLQGMMVMSLAFMGHFCGRPKASCAACARAT